MFLKTYELVLKDGTMVQIIADDVEWCEKPRMVRFFSDKRVVAIFNFENIAGWVLTVNCKVESEVEA